MKATKYYFSFLLLFVTFVSVQAREPIPQWAINEPMAPPNANYVYVSGMGIGNNETEAVNNAWDDALRRSMSRSGLLEFSTEGVEVLRNRVARQMRCQTPAIRLPNRQVKVYVLFQIPIRASETVVSSGQQINCRDEAFERDLQVWNYGKFPMSEVLPRAFVPGMAQIYKGSRGKGIFFIAGQATLISGVVVTESLRATNEARIGTTQNVQRRQQYINNANNFETARNVLIASAAAFYLWNVIDGITARGVPHIQIGQANLHIAPYAMRESSGVVFALNF